MRKYKSNIQKTTTLLGIIILVALVNSAFAANRFWIAAGTANWNSIANWSAASGGVGGASVPGINDVAIFDGGGLGNCTVNANISITSINVNATYTGIISQGANTITTSGTATFAGGTFTGGSADIIFGNAFTLSGASFTSTSTTLEFRHNTAFTSGTFTHNNGSVKYNCTATGAQTISGTSPVFYNLEFVGLGRAYTISSAGNITVTNTLTISGALFNNINTGSIDVNGDINITNSATGGGGSATINIIGTGTQNFNGAATSGQGALPKLTINKSSGTLNLNNFPAVANDFTYTAGTVNPGTSTFCFTRGSVGAYAISGSLTFNNITFWVNAAGVVTNIAAATTLTANGDLTLAGLGNITINTGAIAVNGNINLTNTATAGGGSGTITILGSGNQTIDGTAVALNQSRLPLINISKPSGTLTLSGIISSAGNITYVSGTIDPTTSTLAIVANLTITGSFTVYNFTLQSTGNMTLTIASGSMVTVSKDFTIANGANNVNINTGTIEAQGDIFISNSATAGGGSGTILIDGIVNQNISSTGVINQGRLPAIIINKAAGTLVFPSLITVVGNWTYVTGTLDVTTNNSTVVFANSVTITGSHTLNSVNFFAAGNYTITVAAGTTLSLNGTLTISGTNSLTINTGNIDLYGDMNLTNTGLNGGGSGTITFKGTTNQNITGILLINQSRLPAVTINKPSGTLLFASLITVRGNWTYVAGTLDVLTNNSTVVFENSLSISGNHSLNNITFDASGNFTYNLAGTTLTALGDMTISGANNVILNNGTINLNGNLQLTNTAIGGGGTTVIAFVSPAAQSINSALAINQSALPAVNINKPSGTLTFPALITVRGNWTYTAGTMDVTTNNSTVVFNNTLTITGTHSLNNINFEASGNYTYTFALGTLLTVNGTINYTGASSITITTAIAGSTVMEAMGDITINNTSVGGGGTGLILIKGTGTQNFSSTVIAGQGRMPYIKIQKTSGTLNLSGIISESRDWTYVSGTVSAGTSTVAFGGNNLSVTSNGMSFNNVNVFANTSSLINAMTVTGNLAITGGALAPGANTINLSGNWNDYGTAGFTEATSTVNFVGSAVQVITVPGGESFTNFNLNNTGAGVQLANDVIIGTSFTMTQGNLDLNGNNLTLGTSTANKGNLTRTSGTIIGTGTFKRWFNTAVIPDGSALGLFPMGTATDYRPFYVSAPVTGPTAGGTITVNYVDATTATAVSFPDGAFTVLSRKDFFWNVVTGNGMAGGNYNLRAEGTGITSFSNVNELRLTLANSVVGTAGVNAGTLSNPQVNRVGLSFANLTNSFFIASITAALPITLVSFDALAMQSSVKLTWETTMEMNNAFFTIERSADGISWKEIERINSKGNSSTPTFYSSFDNSPESGVSYYRLKQTDLDGKSTYSSVRSVRMGQKNVLNVYPNPATDHLTISYSGSSRIFVQLFNSSGQQVSISQNNNGTQIQINLSSLNPGVYFVKINQDENTETLKILKK